MRKLFCVLIFSAFQFINSHAQENDDRGYIVKVGDQAPAFEFELTDGTKVKSKKLDGSVVMLQFTASWCGVCRKEMPFIESEIWQVYRDKGLKLFGVDRDEPLEKAMALAEATRRAIALASSRVSRSLSSETPRRINEPVLTESILPPSRSS